MKKLILFLSISFSLHAQSDSLNVTFSEEKVEVFEKTTLIDEYEKAFGGNREVKSGLRVRISDPGVMNFQSVGLQYEQKIGKDFSVIGSFGNIFQQFGQTAFESNIEARWYFKMKDKVKNGLQKPNITGTYLSFKVQYYPDLLGINNFNTITPRGIHWANLWVPNFGERGFISLNLGKQFSNALSMNFILGLKRGIITHPYTVLNSAINKTSSESVNRLFFTTQNQIGLGLLFPSSKVNSTSACEFLLCNVAMNKLWKFNLNNALYVDNTTQNINLDFSYERRIANSGFTINSNVIAGLKNLKFSDILYFKDSTIVGSDGTNIILKSPIYCNEKTNQPTFIINIKEQLRYYFPKKDSFKKSKKNHNFNGIYTGLEYLFGFNKVVLNKKYSPMTPTRYDLKAYSVIFGYQTLTNRESYLDIGLAGGIEGIRNYPTSIYSKDWMGQAHFELSIKLGLAK